MNVRTRIAPSPTGSLHIGTIRTSLYDYAFAKKYNGQFIIRIEDTDRKRLVDGAVDMILDLHDYMGLVADESPRVGGAYSPYTQSERLDTYLKYARQLVEQGNAYYCFCSEDRLNSLKKDLQDKGYVSTKYDKHCLGLAPEEVKKKLESGCSHVIRLNVPKDSHVTWNDEVYGQITVPTNDIDDQVLIKSDGFPTYHLAVVVDDHIMNITHILRGNDWIPSTPKHVLLYKYFGWDMPLHVHLPNLKEVGSNKKLSKRFGAVALYEFLKDGYLPQALLNQFMFLGWNPGTEKEIYSLEEFIRDFSIDKIQKTDLVSFDRNKLLWFNAHYIREMPSIELLHVIDNWAKKFEISLISVGKDTEYTSKALELVKDRIKVLSDFNFALSYFFNTPEVSLDLLLKYATDSHRAKDIVASFITVLEAIPSTNWEVSTLDSKCHEVLSLKGYKPKEAFMTLRVALTGRDATPPIFDIMCVLGKDETLKRLVNLFESI